MLTKLTIRNFKLFTDVEIELGERVIFIGPNNSGKTSALQAPALWDIGVKRWLERRGGGIVPTKRPGVTLSRQDLIAIPTLRISSDVICTFVKASGKIIK